ncbi:S26 family signal peptidase, partial [Mycobacterium tuberculosis]|nr:S26 family signal peptidase [Mycobacterium tuberculosis]
VVLGAISDWRDNHALLINTTDSLPNWAFVIHRNKVPVRGEYVFFDPPPSDLVRRHFGDKPQMFGKIVYGLPGDVVAHWHRAVT